MNYWLFGNNPSNRNGWSEENDITKWVGWKYSLQDFQILIDQDKDFEYVLYNYYVSRNIKKINTGDVAFFWSFPNFCITTIGVILNLPYEDNGVYWVDLFLKQLDVHEWISGVRLKDLDEWKNKKPFTYSENGKINSQFANPKKLSIGEASTIIDLLAEEKIEFMFNDELFNILQNVYENDFLDN
tara:strand:+ start:5975 stop:6529 length:555 start_codon:yes stop_codon:yes gene_type:complete